MRVAFLPRSRQTQWSRSCFGGGGGPREAGAAEQPRAEGAHRLDLASPLPTRPLVATGQEAWLVWGGFAGPTNPCQAVHGQDQGPAAGNIQDGWRGGASNPESEPIGTSEAFLPLAHQTPKGGGLGNQALPSTAAQPMGRGSRATVFPWHTAPSATRKSLSGAASSWPGNSGFCPLCQRKDLLAQGLLWPAPPGWAPSPEMGPLRWKRCHLRDLEFCLPGGRAPF